MTRIKLIGDHSAYHCGSAAAFRAIKAGVEGGGVVVGRDEDFDLLVVNGEGSMHHESPGTINKMQAISAALENGKRAMLINSVWQENSIKWADILKSCEEVVVREVMSSQELKHMGVPHEIAIDQSYFDIVQECDAADFNRKPVFMDFWGTQFGAFVIVNSKWAQGYQFVDMQKMTWSELVRSLRTASVVVTGRHHGVYAACKAQVPFITMKGNTHKIEGFLATSGSSIPVFDNFDDVKSCLLNDTYQTFDYGSLFNWLETQKQWSLS